MSNERKLIISLLIAVFATWPQPASSQGVANIQIENVAPVESLVTDIARRKALARSVQSLTREAIAHNASSDPAVQKALLAADRAASLTLGQWDKVIESTGRIRALEPKLAMQSLEGLTFETFARASRNGAYSSASFAKIFSSSLAQLPGSTTASSIRSLRTNYYLTSRKSVTSRLDGSIAGQLERRQRTADLRLVTELMEQLFVLDHVVPELAIIERLFAERLSKSDMLSQDLWSPRQVQLSDNLPLQKVIVGIWDSGVDQNVFPGKLWSNVHEVPNGVDDDANGFIDDLHGFAFDVDRQPTIGMLSERPGKTQADFDKLASYSIGRADLEAGETSQDAKLAASVAASLSTTERTAFDLDLDRLSFYTHGTGITSIALSGNPAAQVMVGRLNYRLGEAPAPIDEADAKARIAYADKAIDYFKRNGARVVNMSFRLTLPNVESSLASVEPDVTERRKRAQKIYDDLHAGFEKAVRSAPGILFVAGAGNYNENNDLVRSFPAGIEAENLIVVGAVDSRLLPADITSFGKSVDIYALGVLVPQALVGGRTIRFTGTSSATPHVTNLAGKLLALCPHLTVAQLRQTILDSATLEGPQKFRVVHPRAAVASVGHCSRD